MQWAADCRLQICRMQGGEFYEGESRVWGRSKKRVLGLEGGGCLVLLLYIVGIDNNAVVDIAFDKGGERGVGKRGID